MLELIFGTYGVLCWLIFKKWKLVPTNAYTVCTAILIALGAMGLLLMMLMMYHPASKDARLYVYTTPIVSLVKGQVIEVIPEGVAAKKGDVLFRIDPAPYQYAVDGLEASLAAANSEAAQLQEKLSAAMAVTEQARANLRASESDFDRQAREALDSAKQGVIQATSQAEYAKTQLVRYTDLLKSGAVSQAQLDAKKNDADAADAQLAQAQAAERQAEEKLTSGGDKLAGAREAVAQAEAQERQARLAVDTLVGGVSPQVRQIMAALDSANFDLANTVVRAPADGYTTQVTLRPGQVAVPMPLAPLMVFVQKDRPVLAASLPQNVIANIEVGQEAELAFKAYPGRIFKAKVQKILPATAEGQLLASGQLRSLVSAKAAARVPVIFEYEEAVTELGLPGGAQATVAIYTDNFKPLAIMRKILLRIKGWENYIFMP